MRGRAAVGEWYRPRRRRYPWRSRPTPYRVLVSEVMLQQTQVSRVVPAFRSFLKRFPSLRALARSSRADVVRAWSGLGYNRRAVSLHRTAMTVAEEHGGRIPSDPEVLARLPGVGPYTAAAVASIGFGVPVAAVDTNVRRVVSRAVLGVDEAPGSDVRDAARRWLDRDDPGEWNQALMDVGRELCRPVPRCDPCPLLPTCRFRRRGRRRTERSPARTQPRFEGSLRQVRGSIVRTLTAHGRATVAGLARAAGASLGRTSRAIRSLVNDGVVDATPAALAPRPRALVRLSERR